MSPWDFDQEDHGWRRWDVGGVTQVSAYTALQDYLLAYTDGERWKPNTPKDPQGRFVGPWLLHWHAGQVAAFLGNIDHALACMKQCLALHPPPSFVPYAQGTVYFFEANAEGLRGCIELCEGDNNRGILQRLLTGLGTLAYHDCY